jgi:hypothetical protein
VQARQIDSAGNVSGEGSAGAITIDQTAPNFAVSVLGDGQKTAAEAQAGVLAITGNAGDRIQVVFTGAGGGAVTQSLIANGEPQSVGLSAGNLTTLGQGAVSVSITATDIAGNTTPVNASGGFILDTQAPVSPGFTLAADTGGSNHDGITSNSQIIVSGLEAGATWEYSSNGGSTWMPGMGTSFELGAGNHAAGLVRVRQIDAAGNLSAARSNTSSIVVDLTPPAAPQDLALAAASDSGVAGDHLTNVATPTITGAAEAGSTVRLYEGDTLLGSAVANASAAWSITSAALGQGVHDLHATATDLAGHVSALSDPISIEIDSSAPAIPGILPVASDDRINAAEKAAGQLISGVAEPGSQVSVAWGSATRTANANAGDGAWSAWFEAFEIPANGAYEISAVAQDAAGNTGNPNSRSVIIDTTAPAAPSINTVAGDDRVNAEIGRAHV